MELRSDYKHTEVVVIPEDWDWAQLTDLVDEVRSIRYGIVQPGEYAPTGRLMVRGQDYSKGWVDPFELFRVSDHIEQRYKNARLRCGDLIITIVGAGTGYVEEVPEWLDGANLTQTTARIAIDTKKANARFCKYVLQSNIGKRQVANYIKGAAQPGLNCGDVERFLIPLPPTSDEQRAIEDALGDVDALISSLEKLIAKKRDLKQATMQQLLTGQTRLSGFSEDWEVNKFGEIALRRGERIDPRRVGVQNFCVELEHIGQASGQLLGNTATDEHSSLKSVFRAGDVLFGKLRAYLRKYWLADRDGVCSTEIWALVAQGRMVTPEFLFQMVQVEDFVDAASMAYGTHMPRSDWSVVKNYEVPLPHIDEQTAIAAVLSDMDAELAALELRLAKTRALKQGMMQELLTGRTRLV